MSYNFEIRGKINAETIDDTVDILKLIMEDQGITVNRLSITGRKESLSVCKKK